MKRRNFLWLIFLMVVPFVSQSQGVIEASKGDTLFSKGAYFQAIGFYKKATELTTDTVEKCRCKKQLAKCYTQLNVTNEAELLT